MTQRRLTFQLAPLVDLLLIVIFAQYMEVQQSAADGRAELDRKRESLQAEAQEARQKQEADLREQAASMQADFDRKSQELNRKRETYSQQFEQILRQHQQAGETLADSLNLSGRLMEEVLRLRKSGNPEEAAALAEAIKSLNSELDSRGERMIQFLRRYDEMQKHVTIWDVYLQDNGQAMISDGDQEKAVMFSSSEEFASRCLMATKGFTEPRPLVIILLSWGSTQAGQRQRATKAMPLLMEQLRRDAGNTRWFDYSLMGYRLTRPTLTPIEE